MSVTDESMVKSIHIKNLFGMFNYDITYPPDQKVLVTTGPNGCGKTHILNILFNIFNKKYAFFLYLLFDKITICLNNDISIEIFQERDTYSNAMNRDTDVYICFKRNDDIIHEYRYGAIEYTDGLQNIYHALPNSMQMTADRKHWHDYYSGHILSLPEVLERYSNYTPANMFNSNNEVREILDSIHVYFIREQRLLNRTATNKHHRAGHDLGKNIMVETIHIHSVELKELIRANIEQSFLVSQKLDSSYPKRLVLETGKLSKKEYDERVTAITAKQEQLITHGLYERTQEFLPYSEDDAKALLVYLNDLEEKLAVFDDLLAKIALFTTILNERRFTFKSIHTNREQGFYFKTDKGAELVRGQLSSGEQQQVILIYELIFKSTPGTLVLIDVPENSLHVTWQKEFLNDLLEIIELQHFQVLMSTHSPSIINDRWDLVYDLAKANAK